MAVQQAPTGPTGPSKAGSYFSNKAGQQTATPVAPTPTTTVPKASGYFSNKAGVVQTTTPTTLPAYTKEIQDRGNDLYSFHDFNKRVMCATIAQVYNAGEKNGRMEIIKSYAIHDCSTEGIAQAIRQDFPKRRINSIIDMSGTQVNRDTTSPFGVTDRILLEKYGFTIVNSRRSNPLISDTDNTANAFINRGGLIVDPNDIKLLEALSTYHFEDGTRKKLVKYTEQRYAHIDGLGDCIRYGIHHLFPIQHESSPFKEYRNSDQRLTQMNRPGVEHMPYSPIFPGGPTMEELLGETEADKDYMSWD